MEHGHKVMFWKTSERTLVGSGVVNSWEVLARCPICFLDLSTEEVRSALLIMYAPEIAGVVFTAYESGKIFFEAISKLSAVGIQTSFFTKEDTASK